MKIKRENQIKMILLSIVAVVFFICAGAQFLVSNNYDRKMAIPGLKDIVPDSLPGWTIKDRALGRTEAVELRVDELLRSDDFVFRQYTRGNREFVVFVSFWQPGKMPVRLVASHTPDRCWTWAGWQCNDMNHAAGIDGWPDLLPVEKRVFENNGNQRYVWFWHLVDGHRHEYQDFAENPSWTFIFRNILSYGLKQRRAQFFIRIDSNEPIENLLTEPGFIKTLETLKSLGLSAGEVKPYDE